ncbi:MAG: potassium channel family protein [Candidatus Helarchaeota archaeon]
MSKNEVEKEKKSKYLNFFDAFLSRDTLKCIFIAIIFIGIAIGISFLLGQFTYTYLETNASNSGHLYSIILSPIAFFFFAKYYNNNKNLNQLRAFLILYFMIYFLMVGIILFFLFENISYFFSTLGNSLILFSIYTLIIFLLNPGILGVDGNFKKLFTHGKQVRVIIIYLFIVFLEVFGFATLNYAISWFSWSKGWTPAYNITPNPGNWFDFIYFSFITFATIGYGDIHPLTNAAKFSAINQAVISHVISILFLAILFVYISSTIGSNSKDNE